MKTKNIEKGFCRAKTHNSEESRNKKLYDPYNLFFVMGLAVVLLFAGVGVANATNYYVASMGNDSNTGTSPNQTWETLNYACGQLTAGDTLWITNGTYMDNTCNIATSGNSTHPIVIRAYNGTPTFQSTGIYDNAFCIHASDTLSDIAIYDLTIKDYKYGILARSSSWIWPLTNLTIYNNTFEGGGGSVIYVKEDATSNFKNGLNNFNISNNHITGFTGYGIYVIGLANSIISNNTIKDAASATGLVGIGYIFRDCVIRDNYLSNISTNYVISGSSGSNGNTVDNNTVEYVTGRGIRFDYHCWDNIVSNNTVRNTGDMGFQLYPNTTCTIKLNTFEHSSIWCLSITTAQFENNTIKDSSIYLTGSPDHKKSDIVFKNNIVDNPSRFNINWQNNTTISNNIFKGLDGNYGIYFHDTDSLPSENIAILNNVFFDFNVDAITIGRSVVNNLTIKNNIFMYGSGYCIKKNALVGDVVISSNAVWDCGPQYYDDVNTTNTSERNPLFADAPNDFHLKSQYGRWNGSGWVNDDESSPCLNAGELNGKKVNMGAYGNTAEASRCPDIATGTISGTVTADTTSAMIAGAIITVGGTGKSSVTDINGDYTITDLLVGTYIVTCTANDYQDNSQANIKVSEEVTTIMNFTLIPITQIGECLGLWHIDEGAGGVVDDASGNGNNGTIHGTASWTTGKVGTALDFDGLDDYISIPNSPTLNPAEEITLSAWVNPGVIPQEGWNKIIAKPYINCSAPWQQYALTLHDNHFVFELNTEGTKTVITSTETVEPNTWYHVTGTYDGSEMRIYVNAALKGTLQKSGAIAEYPTDVHIGAGIYSDAETEYFNGTIDELKLYNRALTTEEIMADYEACFVELNTLSGTVTSPCGTVIANATVTLTTRSGAEINTTQTDSTGHYAFADVSPDYYDITATKRSYWSNTNNVTVTTEAPETADIVLCQKGDLNTNSEPADAGDLAMMADATAVGTSDVKYDLDGDGNPADEADLTLLKDVSVGVAVLE